MQVCQNKHKEKIKILITIQAVLKLMYLTVDSKTKDKNIFSYKQSFVNVWFSNRNRCQKFTKSAIFSFKNKSPITKIKNRIQIAIRGELYE